MRTGIYQYSLNSNMKQRLFSEESGICLPTASSLFCYLFLHRETKKSWFQTRVYEWDPCFQFPSRMIGTTVLAFICLYLVSRSRQTLFYFISGMELGQGLFFKSWVKIVSVHQRSTIFLPPPFLFQGHFHPHGE